MEVSDSPIVQKFYKYFFFQIFFFEFLIIKDTADIYVILLLLFEILDIAFADMNERFSNHYF